MEVGGKTIEFNDNGFMIDPAQWDEAVATAIAQEDGVDDLTEAHWKVVHFIRAHWKANGEAPTVRQICDDVGLGVRQMFKLFPGGPVRGACRVAGLPKIQEGCV